MSAAKKTAKKTKRACAGCRRLRDAIVNAGLDPDALLKRLREDIKKGQAFWR